MTEPNLFDGGSNQPTIDETKEYLPELVGEGKKFKDYEALAKGKALADLHISNLETRLDQLREDFLKERQANETGAKLQEMLDQLTQAQQLASRNTPPSNEVNNQPPATLKPEDIQSLVSNEISKIEASRRETENYNQVLAKVQERYGSNYRTVLKDQATQLGLSDDDVNAMARKNPNLFLKTFDLNQPRSNQNVFQAPPSSNVRNDNFAPTVQKRTMSYYENMRKTKPTLYYDPKIAVQMDKDAQALGEAFFDI